MLKSLILNLSISRFHELARSVQPKSVQVKQIDENHCLLTNNTLNVCALPIHCIFNKHGVQYTLLKIYSLFAVMIFLIVETS